MIHRTGMEDALQIMVWMGPGAKAWTFGRVFGCGIAVGHSSFEWEHGYYVIYAGAHYCMNDGG
jgi:hypothetical protein